MVEHQFLYKNLNCDPEAHHILALSESGQHDENVTYHVHFEIIQKAHPFVFPSLGETSGWVSAVLAAERRQGIVYIPMWHF